MEEPVFTKLVTFVNMPQAAFIGHMENMESGTGTGTGMIGITNDQ